MIFFNTRKKIHIKKKYKKCIVKDFSSLYYNSVLISWINCLMESWLFWLRSLLLPSLVLLLLVPVLRFSLLRVKFSVLLSLPFLDFVSDIIECWILPVLLFGLVWLLFTKFMKFDLVSAAASADTFSFWNKKLQSAREKFTKKKNRKRQY